MFSIWHLSKLLYMWGTFIVRDCLCVWAIIFNVCHSQRDGTVLHMLCNQAHSWSWTVKIILRVCVRVCVCLCMCGGWGKGHKAKVTVLTVETQLEAWKTELWLRDSLWLEPGHITRGIWRLGIEDFFLEDDNLSNWENLSTKQNCSSCLLTTNSSVTPVVACYRSRFLYRFMY